MNDNDIINYVIDKNGKIVPQRCITSVLANHDFIEYLSTRYNDNFTDTNREIIYRIVNNIEKRPLCKHESCNNQTPFHNSHYSSYCCPRCRNTSSEMLQKNSLGVSKSMKKMYAEHGEEIMEKRSCTLKKNYNLDDNVNVTSPFSIKEIQDDVKKKIFEKYGVKNSFNLRSAREKRKEVTRDKSVKLHDKHNLKIEYTDRNTILVKNQCKVHPEYEIDIKMFNNRSKIERMKYYIMCPICNPKNSFSTMEIQMEEFLKEHNINFLMNTRNIIKPLELDFYCPEFKVAIELNGVFYHSEKFKPLNYHYNKTEICESKNIRLFHIWEDNFLKDKSIIFSMLKNVFGLTINKIYASECEIIEIFDEISRDFLKNNHIEKNVYVNESIQYGLIYNGQLVSIMIIGKNHDGKLELHRYCTICDTDVIGGASKLLNFILSKIEWECVETYVRRDHDIIDLYEQLGFEFISKTSPNTNWIVDLERYSNLEENIHIKGALKIFDSGNFKLVKYKKP